MHCMKELTLEELKRIELEILQRFDAFCKENGITYFLSSGTLLGAVKYRGFIPWDDDIDVLVPRKDYNRLLALFENDARYHLFATERDPAYRYPFAKLCDMTTRKEEMNVNNGVILGVDIDIFPLDAWRSPLARAEREAGRMSRKMLLLGFSKLKKSDSRTPIKRAIKRLAICLSKLIGWRFFVRSMTRAAQGAVSKDSAYLGCKAWPIYGKREILPADVFSETVEVEFEGSTFPAPVGYDTYLRSLYGEYEKDPPPEKQKSHHAFFSYHI